MAWQSHGWTTTQEVTNIESFICGIACVELDRASAGASFAGSRKFESSSRRISFTCQASWQGSYRSLREFLATESRSPATRGGRGTNAARTMALAGADSVGPLDAVFSFPSRAWE